MAAEVLARLTRWFLYLLIGCVVVGAALAILVILDGRYRGDQVRLLLTIAVLAVSALAGMACGGAISRPDQWVLPALGIVTVAVAAGLGVAWIWFEPSDPETYSRWTISTVALAFASAQTSLFFRPRLQDSYRWAQYAAAGVAFLLAMTVITIAILRPEVDAVWQYLAVVVVLDVALSVLVPVLALLSRPAREDGDLELDVEAIDAEIAGLQARIAELEESRRSADESTWMKG